MVFIVEVEIVVEVVEKKSNNNKGIEVKINVNSVQTKAKQVNALSI
jgi:hypothetical protein